MMGGVVGSAFGYGADFPSAGPTAGLSQSGQSFAPDASAISFSAFIKPEAGNVGLFTKDSPSGGLNFEVTGRLSGGSALQPQIRAAAVGGAGAVLDCIVATALTAGVWNHLAFAINASGFVCYVNDVAASGNASVAPLINFSNTGDLLIASTAMSLAELWVAPGQYVNFASLATRRLFIGSDGKPIGLGADGSLPTGTQPALYLSGVGPAFATNHGSCGALTVSSTILPSTAAVVGQA